MITTQKQVQALLQLDRRTRRACGNNLYVVRDPRSRKGGLYYVGQLQRPVIGRSKPVARECWIGPHGSQPGQLSLAAAHKQWNEIKEWSLDHDRDPGEFWTYQKEQNEKQSAYTLGYAVDQFLHHKGQGQEAVKPTTLREYRLKLHNQVLAQIPADTPLERLRWKNGGRAVVMKAINQIAVGEKFELARRCQQLMIQVFNYSLGQGLMSEGQNPAARLKGDGSPVAGTSHHLSIEWDQVPELLERVSRNRSCSHPTQVAATKLILLTFLRAGAATRIRWDWIDREQGLITIPGDTPGLKRRMGRSDHIPHLVPITPQVQMILDQMEEFHGRGVYVFPPLQHSRFDYLDPSAPNDFLKRIGYDGILVVHGWRRVARTYGVDVLRAREVVIERQMGHLPSGKVAKAYDGAQYLDERRDFLQNWNDLLVETGLKI